MKALPYLIAGVLLVGVLGVVAGVPTQRAGSSEGGASETGNAPAGSRNEVVPAGPTPGGPAPVFHCPPQTLCDEDAALVYAYEEFPVGAGPHDGIARLMPLRDALAWQGARLEEASSAENDKPVWLVAVRGTDLTLSQYAPPAARGSDPPLDGMYFIFIASGGGLFTKGGLWDPDAPQAAALGARTYQSVADLTSQSLPVPTPTPYPTVALTPTSD